MAGESAIRSPGQRNGLPPPVQLVVQYVRFEDSPDGRDYVLLAQLGDKIREYRLSIAHAAFSERRALRQDGPDICYQKLMRQLAGTGLAGASRVEVSDVDLAHYRDAHAPPPRRAHPRRTLAESEAATEDPA